jgi:alpha-D-xyloside xylohydrolase
VPTGEDIQFVNDKPDAPITLNIYTGANGHYSLYNDDGRSYDYEQGKYSTIELSYDDTKGTLTIGKRLGEFNGMQQKISINIRWIGTADGMAKSLTGPITQSIEYVGEELVVNK